MLASTINKLTHLPLMLLISIGLGNGLAPNWTNANLLSIGPVGNKFQRNLNRNTKLFIKEISFENESAMDDILSQRSLVSTETTISHFSEN